MDVRVTSADGVPRSEGRTLWTESRWSVGTRRGLRAGHALKGGTQELGRSDTFLTARSPGGDNRYTKDPGPSDGIGAKGAKIDVEVRYRNAR